MRLLLLSDGTLTGTRFFNAETGDPVEIPCTSVTWHMDNKGNLAEVNMTCLVVGIATEIESERIHAEVRTLYDLTKEMGLENQS